MSNSGRFTIVGGGMPIVVDGHVLGGIGCSSGTVHQDREVASAGIAALKSKTTSTRTARKSGKRRVRKKHSP